MFSDISSGPSLQYDLKPPAKTVLQRIQEADCKRKERVTEKLRGRSVYKKLKRDADEQQQKNVIKEKKLREEERKRAANAPKRQKK